MGYDVDASELFDVADDIDRQLVALPGRVYDAGQDVGRSLDRTLDVVTPRFTGYLAGRNDVTVVPLGAGFEVEGHNDARYAGYVHDGTSDTAPQPWMATAADATEGDIGPALLDVSLDL